MSTSEPPEGAPPAPSGLIKFVEFPTRLAGWLSALLLLVTLGIVVFAVIRRYFLGSPLLWGDELLGYLLVAFVMLGAAEALRRGDHIAIDLVTSRLRGRAAWLAKQFSWIAVVAFAVILGLSTWESITFAYDFGSYSPGSLEMATWIPQVPMLIGCVLLALVALTRLIGGIIKQ